MSDPPSILSLWIRSTRPKTLPAAASPVLVGGAMAWADDGFYAAAFFVALLGALLIQVGTNFCNDLFDVLQGADTETRKGPKRAIHAGVVGPRGMMIASVGVFALAALCCAWLVLRAGWPVLAIGVASILSGVWYTAGRYSLAYLGLADLFVVFFFGPVAVGGTYYVQTLRIEGYVLLAGLAPGLISTALLAVNNLRDVDEDREARKRTLAVRFGRDLVRGEYAWGLLIAASVPLLLVLNTGRGYASLAACAILIPFFSAWKVIRVATTGDELNPMLGRTAGMLMLYSLLFSLGWGLTA